MKKANNSILDINSILNEYSDEVQTNIAETAQKVAKKGCSDLKTTSPKRTGKYSKGWRVNTSKGRGEVSSIIYNQNAGLTVLLEKPHLLRNGKLSTPKVHIYPVEQKCIKEYETEVERIIKNGG